MLILFNVRRLSINFVKHHQSIFVQARVPLSSCCGGAMREWKKPEGTNELKLYNSLTREKNDFIPQQGNRVYWYSCGPTVYDASHMGHARSYITFDILRRILSDYFNYDIFYVMNVTDVDDKIINRARRNHLIKQYIESNPANDKIKSDVTEALNKFEEKLANTKDADKQNMMKKIISESKLSLEQFTKHMQDNTDTEIINNTKQELFQKVNDPLSELLDKQFGGKVTDHKIFSALTQHWENEYHEDMKALDVQPADVLTRVSQYVPEIVTYIETIIKNGFAYNCNGSVYFDTLKFANSNQHEYAKLVPEAVGDLDALAEGEGDLSQASVNEKKSDRDFALWKASKPGEPFWESPWGQGRPGWHIECSVMASDVLGSCIDIHTGGVDLKFPHHDNELAQAEAHYGCNQWINYFLHAGHLTIEGCKMSKSLKNFISIKEALKRNSSRQIRFAFLQHTWNTTLDYSTNVLKEAEQAEKMFADFFLNVKDVLRKPEDHSLHEHNFRNEEKALQTNFLEKKQQVHAALCDSIDTATALQIMQSLLKQTNIYIAQARQSERTPSHELLRAVAKYLTRMFKVFGANHGEQEIGFPASGGSQAANREEIVMPYVDLIAEFREDVRKVARKEKVSEILSLCDVIRDVKLVDLGVQLEDQEGDLSAVVKLMDKETILKERAAKQAEIDKKTKAKEDAKRKQLEEKKAKDAKAMIHPSELFKNETDKYSKFDEQGIPTHDVAGEPISASQIKKMKKVYTQQEKLHNKYLENNKT